tara:strand:- start:390 stop:764 length:375 start_codon:yes stop_codon:yes gene_type:complete
MALTITKERNSVSGSRITAFLTVVLDNSYPTGGYVFNLAGQTGLSNVDSVSISQEGFATNVANFHFLMDPTNVKILCMGDSTEASGALVNAGGALTAGGKTMIEAANATDLTGITLKIAVTGRR